MRTTNGSTTVTSLNIQAKKQRTISAWATVHIPKRQRTKIITTHIQHSRKSHYAHINNPNEEGHDSKNITMPETLRIISMSQSEVGYH